MAEMTQEMVTAQAGVGEAFAEAAAVMARLRRVPDGCPWDLEQTVDSIKPHTLEEVYEVFDAIDRRAWGELRDELGDLLLQVLFYARIAEDDGHFSMEDVVRGLSAKLLRRHPHIFGEAVAETPDAVIATWERVKREEKAGATPAGLLEGVPRAMPGFVEAVKLGRQAAKVGFDWPDAAGLFAKVDEEMAEVRAELTDAANAERVEEEFGDVLFTMANLARHLKVDPEQALKKANAKFRRRFCAMEESAGGEAALRGMEPAELEALWARVKRGEAAA